MTTKYTKGPWFTDTAGRIWRRDPSTLYENGGGVAGDKPIAFVNVGWIGEGESGYPITENARLMAAAPDLLEALQNIAEYWSQDQNEEAMADACWHAIHTARAAIAKATGEQP